MVRIIADLQEKNSSVISSLIGKGFSVSLEHLKVADYLIGDIAVERKTVNDFVSSMLNKRLLRQLEEIKQYKKRLLVIEGIQENELYADGREGIHANAIRGMLLSCIFDYEVPIVMTKTAIDTAQFFGVLAKRLEKSATEMSLRAKKKAFSSEEQQQMILEGFPGIGPKTAKALLAHFRTLHAVMNASAEELEKVEGMNEKKRDGFLALMREKYRD